jgi:hypothetical protein
MSKKKTKKVRLERGISMSKDKIIYLIQFTIMYFCTFSIDSEPYMTYHLKEPNLKFRIPIDWKQEFPKQNKELKHYIYKSRDSNHIKLDLFIKEVKQINTHKNIQSYLRKQNFQILIAPKKVDLTIPNLSKMDAYISLVSVNEMKILSKRYIVTATDGRKLIMLLLDSPIESFDRAKPTMEKIMSSFEMIIDLESYCCSLCFGELDDDKTKDCSGIVAQSDCRIFFSNKLYTKKECQKL